MKPVVFTQRVEVVESYNERRDCADQRITKFIKECGYLPLPIPNNAEMAKYFLEEVRPTGIILTGGNSLVKYGGDAPERDETDRECIKFAIEEETPLYGFCRGMQSVLDFFGNELVDVNGHVAVRHWVAGAGGGLEVNSYHNQGCIGVRTGELEVLLHSEDGVAEKIRHKALPIVATMWHPEREDPFRDVDLNMVRELFGGIK